MQLCVVGGGFVGVTTATVFAEWGNDVTLVERDAGRREALASGKLPFYEKDLDQAWSNASVRVVEDVSQAPAPDLAFICVGTPSRDDGSADLSFIEAATRDVAAQGWNCPVVIKSTVPPGTTMALVAPHAPAAMNPEFLREGCALADARKPDRVVLGVAHPEAGTRLQRLYADVECPVVETDPTTAEMVKYASNAMLATRISFCNELSNICQAKGVSVDEVMSSVGLDFRIGPHFLKAGVGFGGSCFPKDVKALRSTAAGLGLQTPIMDAVLETNEKQPIVAVDLLDAALGGLAGKRVALLGLAFKPDTSDVRETRALPIYNELVQRGADVVCYDPKAAEEFGHLVEGAKYAQSSCDALSGAAGCIVQTEWPEFRDITAWPPVVVDGRRYVGRSVVEGSGSRYFGVGDGRTQQVIA